MPQIKSIWIDEDEEAEKLYGLHTQLMDFDGEEQIGVLTINSEIPMLENKQNIELPPLPPVAYDSCKMKSGLNTVRRKSKWGEIFRSKATKNSRQNSECGVGISVPFGFQHISHANGKSMFGPSEHLGKDMEDKDKMKHFSEPRLSFEKQKHFSKAFVTNALPSAVGPYEPDHTTINSSSSTMSRNSSFTHASRLFRSMSTNRVLSTATIATSVLDVQSVKNANKKHGSESRGEIPIEYIKNYQFPIVPEEPSAMQPEDVCIADPVKVTLAQTQKNVNSYSLLASAAGGRPDSTLFSTPRLSVSMDFEDSETPSGRKSVNDVLRYYHQASESESISTCPSSSGISFMRNCPRYQYSTDADVPKETCMI